jgi:hypothetical protein
MVHLIPLSRTQLAAAVKIAWFTGGIWVAARDWRGGGPDEFGSVELFILGNGIDLKELTLATTGFLDSRLNL